MKKLALLAILGGLLFLNGMNNVDKTEYMAKYLISLTRYMEWPKEMKSGSFKIGVVGNFGVYKAIAQETMGAEIQHRNVDIQNLSKLEHINLSGLNMLILAEDFSSPENIKKALAAIGNSATLLITEKEGALKYGSAINFILKDGQFGFEINKSNIKKNGIQVSSQIDVFALNVEY